MEVLDGDRTFTVNAESGFHISKGTLHAWRNATTKPARTLLFIAPAGFEGFFEEAEGAGNGLLVPAASHARGPAANARARAEVRF